MRSHSDSMLPSLNLVEPSAMLSAESRQQTKHILLSVGISLLNQELLREFWNEDYSIRMLSCPPIEDVA